MFEQMFIEYVTNFLAETEGKTLGPYPELEHLQQSEVHEISAEPFPNNEVDFAC